MSVIIVQMFYLIQFLSNLMHWPVSHTNPRDLRNPIRNTGHFRIDRYRKGNHRKIPNFVHTVRICWALNLYKLVETWIVYTCIKLLWLTCGWFDSDFNINGMCKWFLKLWRIDDVKDVMRLLAISSLFSSQVVQPTVKG